ncbi:TipAS antibiotic-recognition domain-containing protein [Lactobacillus kullabergensis]|uniref:TipAS antibiotic-recognition domain-containing protein n=1 Tax=Lactobacillus kullabergensis TaxID=1218493 RepID=UPI00224731D5|nr:TipAS antibiotic-recognition domain-containing protein [Lactobacillus kullabergensis]MCX0290425.1 TipAS antibiotic-recognition domain-containing protein [Lactobacillus kullabergensis]
MAEKSQFTEAKYNKMKQTEADLVRDLQAIVKDPSKEADLSDDVFTKHQIWLRIIMPNYSSKIHLGIVNAYDNDTRYQSYYDDKAGKGATKILSRIVKKHLAK